MYHNWIINRIITCPTDSIDNGLIKTWFVTKPNANINNLSATIKKFHVYILIKNQYSYRVITWLYILVHLTPSFKEDIDWFINKPQSDQSFKSYSKMYLYWITSHELLKDSKNSCGHKLDPCDLWLRLWHRDLKFSNVTPCKGD